MSIAEPFHYGECVHAIDCDLCDGIYDPPCPFHRDDDAVTVLIEGFWRLFHALRRATATTRQGAHP